MTSWFSTLAAWPLSRLAPAAPACAVIESIHFETLTQRSLIVRLPRRARALDLERGGLRVELAAGGRRLPAVRLPGNRARLSLEVRRGNPIDEALAFRTRVGDQLTLET